MILTQKKLLMIFSLIFLLSASAFSQDSLNISTESIIFNYWGSVNGIYRLDDSTSFASVGGHGLATMRYDVATGIREISSNFSQDHFGRIIRSGNYAYTIRNARDLVVLDLSNSESPTIVNSWNYEECDSTYLDCIRMKNGYLTAVFSYSTSDLYFTWFTQIIQVYSLEDSVSPELIASAEYVYGDAYGPIQDYAILDSSIYAISYGIQLMADLSLNSSFDEMQLIEDIGYEIFGVNYKNNHLYICDSNNLFGYDISILENPERVCTIDMDFTGVSLDDDGDFLLVSDIELMNDWYTQDCRQTSRYDVSDPENPIEIPSLPFSYNYFTTFVDDDLLIGSRFSEGFQLIDIRDPEFPEIVGAFYGDGRVHSVMLANGWGFFRHEDYEDFIRVDFSDPANPVYDEYQIPFDEEQLFYCGHKDNLYFLSRQTLTKVKIEDDGEVGNIHTLEVQQPDTILSFKLYENYVVIQLPHEFKILQTSSNGPFIYLSSIYAYSNVYDFSDYLFCYKSQDNEMQIYSTYDILNPFHIDTFHTDSTEYDESGIIDFQVIGSKIICRQWYMNEINPNEYEGGRIITPLQMTDNGFEEYCQIDHYSYAHMSSTGRMLVFNNTHDSSVKRVSVFNVLDEPYPFKIGDYRSNDGFDQLAIDDNGLMVGKRSRFIQVFNIEEMLELDHEIEPVTVPSTFQLHNPYPNPFNPSVNLSFNIEHAGLVKLSVYNILGQKVNTLLHQNLNRGKHSINWNAQEFSNGTYFVQLSQGKQSQIKKLLLVK